MVGPAQGDSLEGIKVVSCTSLQPWVARNYTADGKLAGGRTMTQGQYDQLLSVARERGMAITQEEGR